MKWPLAPPRTLRPPETVYAMLLMPSLTEPRPRVLIADPDAAVRQVCRLALQTLPADCSEVADGPLALASARSADLLLLALDLPGLSGSQVLDRLQQQPALRPAIIVLTTPAAPGAYAWEPGQLLAAGAEDYLIKPFSIAELRARTRSALARQEIRHHASTLAADRAELEQALTARDQELARAQRALVLGLAKLVEHRCAETGKHLARLQRYCRVLGEAAANLPTFAGRLGPGLLQAVESASPLHDIGKVAVPDAVLNKPGQLSPAEKLVMQTHTTAGADTLAEVFAQHTFATPFFAIAIDIARYHHERWDGTGYPERRAGEAIPLAARLVAIGDVYDALRSRRVYKPALEHAAAVDVILARSPGHFDPALVEVFARVATEFDQIYRTSAD